MAPLPNISPDDLVRAVEAYYELRVTAPPTSLPGGVHSRAWLVDTTLGRWVVKLSNPRSDPIPKIQRQAGLLAYLNQHAICVPQFLALPDGSYVATVTIKGRDYPLQLMRYELLSQAEPERASEDTLLLVGELAARLHDALDRYPERDTFVADRQKSANEWGEQDEALWPLLRALPEHMLILPDEQVWLRTVDERALAYLQQHYPDPATLSLALLHGDLNFEHIQFLPDGTPYLFDFGDLCWGPVAHELGVFFLNTFCGNELSFSRWEAMRQRILAGYRSTRFLSDLDEAMIPVFMVNRVLAAAHYGVELVEKAGMEWDWKGNKRAYRMAEYLLNRADEMNQP